TAGLGEKDAAGLALQRAMADRVRAAGAVLVGPNCLGIADTGTDLDLTWDRFRPGSAGLISQSGNLGLELAQLGDDAGLGFSRFISVGNQADVDAAECLRALIDHPPTRAIAVYVEDFVDGREFASIAADRLIARGLLVEPFSDRLSASLAGILPPTATTRNPVDIAGAGEEDVFNFERVVRLMAQSGEADALVLTGYFGGYSEQSE